MKKKIKILFVILQMKAGGSEKLVYELISGIDRSIFSPSIAWFKDSDLIEDFKKLDIPLFFIPKKKRIDLSAMINLSNIIKQNKIEIVNAHHFLPLVYSYYGCKINAKTKLIYTEHSMWEIELRPLRWQIVGKYMLNNSDAVVGVSEDISNQLKKTYNLDPQKVHSIANGVNVRKFLKKNKGLDLNLNLAENIIKIVMVANFRRNKNHIFLIKTFNELYKIHRNVHLYLIGQGFNDDLENSEAQVRNTIVTFNLTKKISLLGYRDNVHEIISQMDIACLTSDNEGLPISLIESMAAGLPVVGTNVDGIKNVIIPNYNGFLVEKNNIRQFSNSLSKLIVDKNLREVFGKRSQELAFEKYSMKTCIGKYQNLFIGQIMI